MYLIGFVSKFDVQSLFQSSFLRIFFSGENDQISIKGPIGSPWALMGPYRPLWDPMGPYGTLWDPMGPIWDHVGPFGPLGDPPTSALLGSMPYRGFCFFFNDPSFETLTFLMFFCHILTFLVIFRVISGTGNPDPV